MPVGLPGDVVAQQSKSEQVNSHTDAKSGLDILKVIEPTLRRATFEIAAVPGGAHVEEQGAGDIAQDQRQRILHGEILNHRKPQLPVYEGVPITRDAVVFFSSQRRDNI